MRNLYSTLVLCAVFIIIQMYSVCVPCSPTAWWFCYSRANTARAWTRAWAPLIQLPVQAYCTCIHTYVHTYVCIGIMKRHTCLATGSPECGSCVPWGSSTTGWNLGRSQMNASCIMMSIALFRIVSIELVFMCIWITSLTICGCKLHAALCV